MSTKREQFLKMLGQGWALAAAVRELGVSHNLANNWKNGYPVARPDVTMVVFEALTPAPQPGSARFFLQERLVIADELRTVTSVWDIATLLGRSPSTTSREIRRNRWGLAAYRPFTAEQLALQRRLRLQHRLKIEADAEFGTWVTARLTEYCGPSQIARALPAVFPGKGDRHLAHETIYRAVYWHQLPSLTRHGLRSYLRTGRIYRKAHRPPSRRRIRFGLPVRMISDRPVHVLERVELGH